MQEEVFSRDFMARHAISGQQMLKVLYTVKNAPVVYNRSVMTVKEAGVLQMHDDAYVAQLAAHVGDWCTAKMVREIMVYGHTLDQ